MKFQIYSVCLLLILIAMPNTSNSQGIYADPSRYPTNSINDSFVKANKIAQIIMDHTYFYKRGKPFNGRQMYLYDHHGKSTFVVYFDDTSSPGSIMSFALYNKGTDLGERSVSMHRQYRSTLISIPYFDELGRVVKTQNFRQNGKHAFTHEMFYKDSDLVRYNFLDKKHRLKYYYVYEYKDGKKISSSRFDRKGKLLQHLDFSCDDEGVVVNKSKDSGKVCTHKTYMSDGTIVTTTTYFENGSKPVKYVRHQDSLGNTIKYQFFRGNNLTLNYMEISKFIGRKRSEHYFWYGNSKGQSYYSGRSVMDLNGQIIEEVDTWFRSATKYDAYRYEYKYNDKGLLIESRGFLGERLTIHRRFRFTYYKD